MLCQLEPQHYQRKARAQLEDIKHNLRLLDRIAYELDSMTEPNQNAEREVSLDKSEKLKVDVREKLRAMGLNINEMVAALDYKTTLIAKQLSKIQNQLQKTSPSKLDKKLSTKTEEQYKYQINQLEERIFELQKKQNQHVKQISELKQKNAKLRQQFNNLSFDSNQRIKELSEKLHNNTSPNLTIKRLNPIQNAETSYFINNQPFEKKKPNNFVKIKGANNSQHDLSPLEMSPSDPKKNKNMLESLTSESSEYDIKGLGYDLGEHEQNSSGNLKFGCFPGKQASQKTKTGSSSQNRKLNLEQKTDKSRRFEFLLNNLVETAKTSQQQEPVVIGTSYQPGSSNLYTGGNRPSLGFQGSSGYQYKGLNRQQNVDQYKSVFNQNVIKRYQI